MDCDRWVLGLIITTQFLLYAADTLQYVDQLVPLHARDDYCEHFPHLHHRCPERFPSQRLGCNRISLDIHW